jgi:ATP-binding cassette, subfamily C (CFTR/MRP), member 1
LAPVVTFAVYIIIAIYWKQESLLTAQAFTSLALISLLIEPVILFTQALPQVIQCIGCFGRIQDYCNYSSASKETEIPSPSTTPVSDDQKLGSKEGSDTHSSTPSQSLSFKGHSFSWKQANAPILKDLNFSIERRTITVITGPMASGKSTLLESILGETFATSSEWTVPQTLIAYCSQQPWLEHATIRQNIIGASPFQSDWYNRVVSACDLEPDLNQLEKGDATLVGSKGLNISGGQKQRIVSDG